MGANTLALPAHKTLVAEMRTITPNLTALAQIANRRIQPLRMPPSIQRTLRAWPQVVAWLEKNRQGYETVAESLEASASTTAASRSRPRARAAAGH